MGIPGAGATPRRWSTGVMAESSCSLLTHSYSLPDSLLTLRNIPPQGLMKARPGHSQTGRRPFDSSWQSPRRPGGPGPMGGEAPAVGSQGWSDRLASCGNRPRVRARNRGAVQNGRMHPIPSHARRSGVVEFAQRFSGVANRMERYRTARRGKRNSSASLTVCSFWSRVD